MGIKALDLKFFWKVFCGLLCLALMYPITAQADYRESEVALIEEITINPDGSTEVLRYKPGERPEPVRGGRAIEARRRGLNSQEQLELDQLEADFAHGRISAFEYNSRKREIYRATFVDGPPPDDSILDQYIAY